MAFVYQAERKATHIIKPQTNPNVGPGAYNHQNIIDDEMLENLVAFNSNALRNSQTNKDQLLIPGPGTYNLGQNNINEKIVRSSDNEDIRIIEVPNPQSQFKSQSKRFGGPKNMYPGPGQYEQSGQFLKKQRHYPKSYHNTDSAIMKQLEDNFTKTPSIPSKQHQNGYQLDDKDNRLYLIRGNQQKYNGIKEDRVGPGEYEAYNQFNEFTAKGTNRWAKNDEPRFRQQRESHSVGPGSYDLQSNMMPLYKLKQGSNFASKSLRIQEQRKGAIANSFLKQKSMANTSIASSRTRDQTEFNDSDSEYEYIEDTTPGPGYYHNESVLSSIKPQTKKEKFQFFGTGSLRFRDQQKQYTQAGPGAYPTGELSSFKKAKQKQMYRRPPFQSSNTRFEVRRIKEKKPGPSSYDPRVSLQDKLIDKVQKGYRGNFGSTDQRFKPDGMDEYPGPGTYLEAIQENDEDVPIQHTANFKSKTGRDIPKSKETKDMEKLGRVKIPKEGYYNDYYDISKNVHKDDEPDPELKIPRPGFGSSVANRFPEPKVYKKQDDDDDEDLEYYTKDKQKILEEHLENPKQRKYQKVSAAFGAKDGRFNYKSKSVAPGPGQYFQAQDNTFDIKTFNVKFTPVD